MTAWFTEDPTWAYILCGAAAVIAGFAFAYNRRVLYLGGVVAAVVLAGLFALLDFAVETDREQAVRKSLELAAAAEKGDFDQLASLFSDRFHSDELATKEILLRRARIYLPSGKRRTVRFWVSETYQSRDRRIVRTRCDVKAEGDFGPLGEVPFFTGRIDLTFVKDSDGQWRISGFRVARRDGSTVRIPQ